MAFQYECDPGKHLFISWSEFKCPWKQNFYRIESTISSCASGWAGGEQDYMWQDALTWQKTLPSYKPDTAALGQIEAKDHSKIIEYLKDYHTEVAGSKYLQYLRPDDGIVVE